MPHVPFSYVFEMAQYIDMDSGKRFFATASVDDITSFFMGSIYYDRYKMVRWMLDRSESWPNEIWTEDFFDSLDQTCLQVEENETSKFVRRVL